MAEPKQEEKPVDATLTATQAGASKVTIVANKDIETDTITVKKGDSEVKITSKEFTSDGKTATLVLENKIVAADYTVTVSNAAISANFKGELSKLAEINFTSDYAIIDGEFGATKKAYTFYVAQNQWKEDVTESTSLRVTSSAKTADAVKGKVTFEYDQNITAAQLNDPVTCVLYDSTSGVTAQKTLTLSNKALVAEIEPYGENGIYNANGKTLAVTDKYTEAFFYMFRAKDQYGNYLDDTDMLTDNNGFFASFSEGLTNLKLNALTTKIVDGVTYFAYPLQLNSDLEAGTATLILVAGGSGKSVNASIVVASGNTVDKITVTAPTTIAVGDVAKFDFSALDKEGNEVTSYAQLKKVTVQPAASDPSKYGFYWTKVNGKAVLYFNTVGTDKQIDEPSTSMGTLETGTFLTTTYNSSLCSFSVKQRRYPAEIAGLSATAPTAQAAGRVLELKESDFKVVDQYGDAYSLADHPQYAIKAEWKSGSVFGTGSAITYATGSGYGVTSPACTDAISGNNATNQHQALNLTAGPKAGSSVYEFKLYLIDSADNKAKAYSHTIDATTKDVTTYSAKKITLSVSESAKYVSYEVSGPDMLFVTNDQNLDGTTDSVGTPGYYQPSISVVATDNTGAKVKLDTRDFTVGGGKFVAAAGGDKLKSSVVSDADWNKYFSAANTTVDGSYVVTMNDGTVVEKTVKVSNAKPSVASLSYGTKTYIAPVSLDAKGILKDIKGKDNYGFDLLNSNGVLYFAGNSYGPKVNAFSGSSYAPYVTITVTDFVFAESHVTGNGSTDPKFNDIKKGDKFTVEVASGDGKVAIAVVPGDSVYDNTASITDITKVLANNGTVSAAALKAAGIADVVDAYESDYNTALSNKSAADRDTVSEIQEIIDEVNLTKRVSELKTGHANATPASFSAIGINTVNNNNIMVVTKAAASVASGWNDIDDVKESVAEAVEAYNVLSKVTCSIVTNSAVVYVKNDSSKTVSCASLTTNNVVSTAGITAGVTSDELSAGDTATIVLRTGNGSDTVSNGDDTLKIAIGKFEVTITISSNGTNLDAADVTPTSITAADITYTP